MIENKKGLSDVVTTVLIILLVLAAVAIIATYVLNAVQKGAEQVSTVCSTLKIEPTQCTKLVDGPLLVKHVTGDVSKVKKLQAVVYNADGTSNTEDITIPDSLETISINPTMSLANAKQASVVASVESESGNVVQCSESLKVDCA